MQDILFIHSANGKLKIFSHMIRAGKYSDYIKEDLIEIQNIIAEMIYFVTG